MRRGVSFSRAVCANPICTPSRAEILSGCSGFRNGVTNFGQKIDPALVLWPQAMGAAGYQVWYVGKWHNDGWPTERGFARTRGLFAGGGGRWWKEQLDWRGNAVTGYRGWVFQDDARRLYPERGVGLTADISERFADAAIELLRQAGEDPFFLQVCFTAPHDPLIIPPELADRYDPAEIPLPANYLEQHPFDHGNLNGRDEQLLPFPRTSQLVRQTLAAYYSVITHMDEQIGRILQTLDETGQSENTIVIFSSDHGLGVGSHGIRGKQNMYEHTVNVPLIIAGPDLPQNQRARAQVYLRDLFPTICELTGVEIPATVQGRSFARCWGAEAIENYSHIFCHFRDQQRMVRDDRWKLISYPQLGHEQLFDLTNDPHEMRSLAGRPEFAEVLAGMQRKLRASQRDLGDPLLDQ